jgi:hypothetical protein
MNIELIRHGYLPGVAALGFLTAGSLRFATVEDPWRPDPDGPGGQRRDKTLAESCIPDGRYQIVPHDSGKFPNVYALVAPTIGVYRWPGDIPISQQWGRSAILIHGGNDAEAVMGCIAVGVRHEIRNNRPWVTESQNALEQLRAVLLRDTHALTIRPTTGTAEIAA